jgi:hypothetical protein
MKNFFPVAIVVVNLAGPAETNRSLHRFVMPVATTAGIIYSIDIEDPTNVEGNNLFNHCEITPLICKCL